VFKIKEVLQAFEVLNSSLSWMLGYLKRRQYRFDKRLGVYFHKKTNEPFCPSCLISKNIESPLQETISGWQCGIKDCDKYYINPDYKEPTNDKPKDWLNY
jgi:hypothetical protein